MIDPALLPPIDLDDSPTGRMLRVARDLILTRSYSGVTMDSVAHALGISKKTLYIHFASKEALFAAILEATSATVRRRTQAAMARPGVSFTDTLSVVLGIISSNLAVLTPDFLADLQRSAPQLISRIEAIKDTNIPQVFGRLLALGVERGVIRADIDPVVMVEFWLQAIKGMHQPEALARTGLTHRQAFERALDLYFRGLLTPAGRAEGHPYGQIESDL